MFTLRGIIDEHDGIFHVHSDQIALLNYYANSIKHLFSFKTTQVAVSASQVVQASE
jgi:hypothetical protein